MGRVFADRDQYFLTTDLLGYDFRHINPVIIADPHEDSLEKH